jgi:hypothetical protein
MGRCVDDLALLLPVIAGRDDVDPFVQGCFVGIRPRSTPARPRRIYDHDGVRRCPRLRAMRSRRQATRSPARDVRSRRLPRLTSRRLPTCSSR